MKNRIITSTFRKITSTSKRYLSLMVMSLLGVGFFAGIEATAPDMQLTLDKYLDNANFYDFKINSTLGLTENDLKSLSQLPNVDQVTASYFKDVLIATNNHEYAVKIHSITPDINKITITEGKMPNEAELLVEEQFLKDNDLKIGDTITIEDANLASSRYTISGTVKSPFYFSFEKGSTNISSGKIDYYMYLNADEFIMEYYPEIYITTNNTKDLLTGSQDYKDTITNNLSKIESIQHQQEDQRYNEIFNDLLSAIPEELYQLNKEEIDQTIANEIGQSKWIISIREDNSNYNTFTDSVESITRLGSTFPIIFYFVAVLISLITMTRMVEEDRTEIGTLKSLGYRNGTIMFRYFAYSLSSTIVGGLIGMCIGFVALPTIIWNIYRLIFDIDNFVLEFNFTFGFIGLFISVLCITLSTYASLNKSLKENSASLLRPKAPKIGKRIILEYIPFIWHRLSFSSKITARNILRYKKRVLMMLIGIGGCTSLILAGLGLKDSIAAVSNIQYQELFQYDAMIVLKGDNYQNIQNQLNNISEIKSSSLAITENYKVANDAVTKEATLITTSENLPNIVNLRTSNKKPITLKANEIVITQKLAKLIDVKIGDTITITDSDLNEYKFKVSNIAENYIQNYIFVDIGTYQEKIKEYHPNSIYINYETNDEENLHKTIMNNEEVSTIITTTAVKDMMDDMLNSLNSVVLVLIVSSSLLAIVVLYNLSNINISERRREIATLKVLGFYNKEVDSYISRENNILTFVGIIIGLLSGSYVSNFIISTCEPEYIMFVRHINLSSYIIAIIITIIFSIIISILNHYALKKINMVDSLKSID